MTSLWYKAESRLRKQTALHFIGFLSETAIIFIYTGHICFDITRKLHFTIVSKIYYLIHKNAKMAIKTAGKR